MPRPLRARDLELVPSPGRSGDANAITDVDGVAVGHVTIRRAPEIHSGVTAIVPGDIGPDQPLPAGAHVANGFGKLVGYTQLMELGRIESPIVLTSTMSAFRAADAVVDWMLSNPKWQKVTTFNPVVGECNDGHLSDIRSRPVRTEHVLTALRTARGGQVDMGSVGAGTGMVAMGFKAGIGTASRIIELTGREFVLGGLVQANFGGTLRMAGQIIEPPQRPAPDAGSCMLVLATDAPLDGRQLNRLAARAAYGLGRVGASYGNGSGDYAIAFTTTTTGAAPPDDQLNPLFSAALDMTEEMVLDSLIAATATSGHQGRKIPAVSDTAQWRSITGR